MKKLAVFLMSILSLTLILGACGEQGESSGNVESPITSGTTSEAPATSESPITSEGGNSETSEEPENSETSESPTTSEEPENSESSEQPEVITYTVTFDCGGLIQVATQTVVEGEKATAPTIDLGEDYVFEGWTVDGAEFNFNTAITDNIVVTMVYARLYTVTFDCGEWKGLSIPAQKVKEGETVTLPQLPASQEYEFKAWLLNGVAFDETTPITGNITLTLDCEVYGSIV